MKQNLLYFINSLTKQEKRYFKLHASQVESEEGNMYIYLFDLIESNNPDDEPYIKDLYCQKFDIKTYISTKFYLRIKLLEALRLMQEHTYPNTEQEVSHLIENANIFYKKGFYSLSEREILRAEKLAEESELWDKLHAVIEKKLAFFYDIFINNKTINEQVLTEMIAKKNHALAQWTAENNLLNIIHEMYFLLRTWDNSQKQDRIADFLNNPILQNPPSGINAQIKYYLAKSRINKFLSKNEDYCDNYRNVYELYQKQKATNEIEARTHLMIYNNFITALAAAQKIEEAEKVLEHLQKEIPAFRKLLSDSKFATVSLLHAQKVIYLHSANYIALSELEEQFTPFLAPGNPYFPKTIIIDLRYGLAFAHFKLKNYDKALQQLNTIVHDKELLINCSNFYKYVYIVLYLLCHYEMENFQFLHYEIDRQKELANKLQVNNEVINVFFKMLKKLIKTSPPSSKAIFVKYLPIFQEYENKQPQTVVFLSIVNWIQEKLEALA